MRPLSALTLIAAIVTALQTRAEDADAFRDKGIAALKESQSNPRAIVEAARNFVKAADLYGATQETVRHHVAYGLPILIDARLKRGFPRELSADPETADRVGRRWSEYFDRPVEMGDAESAGLDKI